MKVLKILLVVLAVLVAVFIVVNLVSPSKMIVAKSITVHRSAPTVFPEMNDLRNRVNWSPWELADSTMEISYGDVTEGVGARTSWVSENSGSGSQEIVESRPYEFIKTQLEFDDRPGINYSEWRLEELGDSTLVTWTFDGSESPFWGRMFNLIFKGMVEEMYESGLKNLKEYVEAKPRIVIKDIGAEVFQSELTSPQFIITMIDTTTPDGVKEVYEHAYSAIAMFMEEKGLEKEAAPVGIYHAYSDSLVILEPGIPVSSAVEVPEGMIMKEIAPTKVASATHVGAWENIGSTHEAIMKWIEENGAEMNGSPWHVYFNTLEEVEDPANLYTQVHYPIK